MPSTPVLCPMAGILGFWTPQALDATPGVLPACTAGPSSLHIRPSSQANVDTHCLQLLMGNMQASSGLPPHRPACSYVHCTQVARLPQAQSACVPGLPSTAGACGALQEEASCTSVPASLADQQEPALGLPPPAAASLQAPSLLALCRSLSSAEVAIFKAALAQLLQSYGVVSSYITIGTPTPVAGRRLLQASLGLRV